MSRTIRIAVPEKGMTLHWPERCPACGTEEDLVEVSNRVGRVKSVRPNLLGGISLKSNLLNVHYLMCRKHAWQNTLANRLWDRGPGMRAVRGVIYLGLLSAISSIVYIIRTGDTATVFLSPPLAGLKLIGLFGTVLLLWARQVCAVRLKGWDADVDVIDVEFSDVIYATDFKRKNKDYTDDTLTASVPWYRKSAVWKAVLIAGLLLFVGYLMKAR